MGPNDPYSELVYHDDKVYEDWISSWFTLVNKNIMVIMQVYIGDSEQVL